MNVIFQISQYLPRISYLGIFLLLLVFDSFIPLPEEVVLLFVGYAGWAAQLSWWWLLPVAFFGVVIGDMASFSLIATGSAIIKRLVPKINKRTMERYQNRMQTRLGSTIFFLRFVAAFRYISPVVAASLKTSFRQYLIYDTLALLVYVPLYVGLGFLFHAQLSALVSRFDVVKDGIFLVVLVVVGFLLTLPMKKELADDERHG